MKRKEEIRKEKEKETMERLKKQEMQFLKKRMEIVKNQNEMERQELVYSDELLSKITDKLNTSTQKEQSVIQSMAEKAK